MRSPFFQATGADELGEELGKAGTRTRRFIGGMKKATRETRKHVRRQIGPGGMLRRASGNLENRIQIKTKRDEDGQPIGRVWPAAGYASVHVRGAVIRAKTAAGMRWQVARIGGAFVAGGVYKRRRSQQIRAAEKAGAQKTGVYRTSGRGKGAESKRRVKGEAYYTRTDLQPFRRGISRKFAAAMRRGTGQIGWVRVMQVTIPKRDFLSAAARTAAPVVREILGDAFLPWSVSVSR